MNESNGKLELDNWIHMGIVHVVNQTQSMFKSYTKVLNLGRRCLMVSMDQCMSIS